MDVRGLKANQDQRAHKAQRGRRENKDQPGPRVQRGRRENKDQPVPRVQRGRRVPRAQRALPIARYQRSGYKLMALNGMKTMKPGKKVPIKLSIPATSLESHNPLQFAVIPL